MIDQPKIIAQSIQQLQYIWEKKILNAKMEWTLWD
jgi:hypothetical protein